MDSSPDTIVRPHLLALHGSAREMGAAQGAAARREKALDCLEYYGTFMDRLFEFQSRPSMSRLRRKLRWLVGEYVEQRFLDRIPQFYREMSEGFAQGSGLPISLVLKAFVMPDVYTYLLARQQGVLRALRLRSPAMGCSSFVAIGDKARGSRLLHGRNLDFPGGTAWYSHPAVVEYAPRDGQRYVSVTSLAISSAGITAMNEAGITLSLNMNYSLQVGLRGTPIVAIGHEVMRRAKTLKDAVEILNQYDIGAGWSFAVSSWKEANALVLESDAQRTKVRGIRDGYIVCTNHYQASDLRDKEYWITESRRIDTTARFDRITALLAKRQGMMDVKGAIDVLSDSFDPFLNANRAFGSTVCQVHTVTSVVMDPEARKVHVAVGPAPVPRNSYWEIEVFGGPTLRDGRSAPTENAQAGRNEYCAAYESYFPGEDLVATESHLEQAVAAAPQENLYRFILGLVQLKRRSFVQAQRNFETALALNDTKYRTSLVALYLARTYDLLGDRENAVTYYRRAAEDPNFRRKASKGVRKAWTWKRAKSLVIDFTIGDAVEPF